MKEFRYPKVIVVRPDEDVDFASVQIHSKDLIDADDALIERREVGELSGHGFYLDRGYNWQIVQDSEGMTVLVPTRKDEFSKTP